MATGPTGTFSYDEMMDEGCRLAKDLKKADAYIENLLGEIAVFKAERDQADEEVDKVSRDRDALLRDNEAFINQIARLKYERNTAEEEVLRQANDINDLKQQREDLVKEVDELKANLQEWVDFEGWRQGRWVLVQEELKKLRAALKNDSSPDVTKS